MKCETPARSARSSREPAPIQKPSATERTLDTRSEMTRSPESSSESTYFCTGEDPSAQEAERFVHRVDRSFQTDARAKPARPDDGTASGALGREGKGMSDRISRRRCLKRAG